jgi:hypothetical protein
VSPQQPSDSNLAGQATARCSSINLQLSLDTFSPSL